ncbi:IucA/IucC family protein [Jiella mangrovi]|uniref:IucA/IucC family siderophore biosynthesis protein n=1 Tax=Jiella mangrovi TaxID=2821407 RepID=A0ABS4BKC7_9HYPH|nr:IucA/IucC family protein [Jiella mangrovi]MBP0616400.1 hypothetical protein [Jiella mangrovi]
MTETADIPALDAFLNAALRENRLKGAHFNGAQLRFALCDESPVTVAVIGRSRFRCRFAPPLTIAGRPARIEELLQRLTETAEPAFSERVAASLRAIRGTSDAEGDPQGWNFRKAETALRFGHVLHPNPRSRDGITAEEAAIYAPESGGRFALEWFAVEPERWTGGGFAVEGFSRLARADGIEPPTNRRVFPVHPFQLSRLKNDSRFADLRAKGSVEPLGPGRPDWSATASMRAVHGFHAPFMVKFSLSLRLTNSMRLLSHREVLRGLHVTDLLNSAVGAEISATFAGLTILTEPAFAALTNERGALIPETIAVLRDNPYRDAAAPGPVILAALCEAPRKGLSPLGRIVTSLSDNGDTAPMAMRWFAAFLDKAIWPILEMRARFGLLFGSHQQNMMLKLEGGWPSGVAIRDCQGTGHLTTFHERLSSVCPGIGEGAENIVPPEAGDALLTYYVVVNSVMNTLSMIVLDELAGEDALLALWRSFLERCARETPGDATLYRRLLERPGLTAKANFATSLSGVNEADGGADGQLASFLELDNPIALTEAA